MVASLRVSALVLTLTACGCGSTDVTQASDPEVPEAAGAEVRRRPSCPVSEGSVCRALNRSDVTMLLDSAAVAMPGSTFSLDDGSFVAFAALYDQGATARIRSSNLREFTAPEIVTGATSDVTGARGRLGPALYFVGGSGPTMGLYRSSVGAAGELSPPTRLDTAHPVPFWPQAVGLKDGRVLLAYAESQKRAFLAVSADGNAPFVERPTPVPAGDRRGILASVGETRDGTWIFTHQIADEQWLFASYVHLSRDEGATWSAPINVAPEAGDVHDTYPITRTDKGADLYYLHVGAEGVFSVFRRALLEDQQLGPEQAVTGPSVGHVEKPQARRLPDGRIALTFAVRNEQGGYGIGFAALQGDAPLR